MFSSTLSNGWCSSDVIIRIPAACLELHLAGIKNERFCAFSVWFGYFLQHDGVVLYGDLVKI